MRAPALLIAVFTILAVFTFAGCLEANVDDGLLICSDVPDRRCPRGYYCAANNYCYHDGHAAPPPRWTDMAMWPDFTAPRN
jgi:hypothetical protein